MGISRLVVGNETPSHYKLQNSLFPIVRLSDDCKSVVGKFLSLTECSNLIEVNKEFSRSVRLKQECKRKIKEFKKTINSNLSITEIVRKLIFRVYKNDLTLTELKLGYNYLGVEGGLAMAEALKSNTILKKLNLELCNIGDVGLIALARALSTNKTLTTLNLNYIDFKDDGVKALLTALETNRTLTRLDFSDRNISNELYSQIQEKIKLNKSNLSVKSVKKLEPGSGIKDEIIREWRRVLAEKEVEVVDI